MAAAAVPGPRRVVRLTFAFDEGGIRLIDRTPVEKRIPPSDDVVADPPPAALAAELRTSGDAPTFRRVLHEAIPQDVEVFDPDQGVSRHPVAPASGAFTVLVPDDEDASDVVLVAGVDAVPAQPGIEGQRAFRAAPPGEPVPQELARFPFREPPDDGRV